MKHPVINRSVEYNDNRIARYIAQQGNCAVTGRLLEVFDMELHHIIPTELGGTDRYNNLVFIAKDIHKLIHATAPETINKYLQKLKLSEAEICKVNELRVQVENEVLI